MKKFRFSLQALHTLRERQERHALQDYSRALGILEQARHQVTVTQEELERIWGQMRESTLQNFAALGLDQLHAYSQKVQQRTRDCENAATVARTKTSQAYAKFLAARHACAVVDKFFQSQKRRHDRERRRYEQRALDEMANHQNALSALVTPKEGPLRN